MATRLRKWRQRFGINAPRVAVHSHVPWYWRWVAHAVLLGVSAASAAWIYDAGRRFAGFDRSEALFELGELRQSLEQTRAELERLRASANAAESRVAIERTAHQKLAQDLRVLEQENARLREELATFESIISSEARNVQSISVYRFSVEPDVLPGEYRYRLLLLTPTTRKARDFEGRLELVVNLTEGERSAMMSFPEQGDAGAAAFKLAFRYFRRVEGTFRVNRKAPFESVQVRIYETGGSQPSTPQSVTLG